jgi:hypothetical protein
VAALRGIDLKAMLFVNTPVWIAVGAIYCCWRREKIRFTASTLTYAVVSGALICGDANFLMLENIARWCCCAESNHRPTEYGSVAQIVDGLVRWRDNHERKVIVSSEFADGPGAGRATHKTLPILLSRTTGDPDPKTVVR